MHWSIILEIVLYASLFVGAMTAGTILYLVYRFRYEVEEKDYPSSIFNDLTAGAVGGVIAGILVGAIGGYWFGMRREDPPDPGLLVWGAVAGLATFGLTMGGIASGSGSFTQFAPGVTMTVAAIAAAIVFTTGLSLGSGSSLVSLRRHLES